MARCCLRLQTARLLTILFESHNVIAELKTMLNDSTAEIDAKVLAIVQDWRKKTGMYPPSHYEGDKRIFEIKKDA